MGTIYTLPVLTYPNFVPTGTGVVTTDNYDDCLYGINNSLLVCGNGTANGVGSGSNVANTICAWYINTEGSSDRYYYIAINRNSSWIHSTVSITDLSSSTFRSCGWGLTTNANEPLYGSNANYGYTMLVNPYSSVSEAERALGIGNYPITYRDTNCTHSGPNDAFVGNVVSVSYQFPEGYGIVNPSADIYATNNGAVIPSQYSNGVLTFTMPDPSQSG